MSGEQRCRCSGTQVALQIRHKYRAALLRGPFRGCVKPAPAPYCYDLPRRNSADRTLEASINRDIRHKRQVKSDTGVRRTAVNMEGSAMPKIRPWTLSVLSAAVWAIVISPAGAQTVNSAQPPFRVKQVKQDIVVSNDGRQVSTTTTQLQVLNGGVTAQLSQIPVSYDAMLQDAGRAEQCPDPKTAGNDAEFARADLQRC